MGQLYLQRFEYRGAVDKAAFDEAWRIGLETFAKTGNWGGVAKGAKHIHTYGTAWGGYIMIDVDDPKVFDQYQMFLTNTYGHMARNTFEPLSDMDEVLAPTIKELRAKPRKSASRDCCRRFWPCFAAAPGKWLQATGESTATIGTSIIPPWEKARRAVAS